MRLGLGEIECALPFQPIRLAADGAIADLFGERPQLFVTERSGLHLQLHRYVVVVDVVDSSYPAATEQKRSHAWLHSTGRPPTARRRRLLLAQGPEFPN